MIVDRLLPRHLIVAIFVIGCIASDASATISFELPEIELEANEGGPTVGLFDVLVRVDASDLPQSVAGVNLHFGTDAGSLVLGPAEAATTNPLFMDGDFRDFSPDIFTILVSDNGLGNEALADGVSLVQVPFSVPSGVTGSFDLQFLGSNSLVDGLAEPLPVDLSDTGSITIVAPGVPGDYDDSGTVDIIDYTIWRDTLGSTSDLRANGDDTGASAGIIDEADHGFWKARFGDSDTANLLQANGAVPEPSSVTLALAITATVWGFVLRNGEESKR